MCACVCVCVCRLVAVGLILVGDMRLVFGLNLGGSNGHLWLFERPPCRQERPVWRHYLPTSKASASVFVLVYYASKARYAGTISQHVKPLRQYLYWCTTRARRGMAALSPHKRAVWGHIRRLLRQYLYFCTMYNQLIEQPIRSGMAALSPRKPLVFVLVYSVKLLG